MNTYRVQVRAGAGWVFAHIQARTMYDARDLAALMFGSEVMGYPEIVT